MPRLIRLYIQQIWIGFALAALLVALIVGFDIGHLRHLVLQTQGGLLAGFLLWVINGIAFAGVQFGLVVLGRAQDDDDDNDGPGGRSEKDDNRIRIPIRDQRPRR